MIVSHQRALSLNAAQLRHDLVGDSCCRNDKRQYTNAKHEVRLVNSESMASLLNVPRSRLCQPDLGALTAHQSPRIRILRGTTPGRDRQPADKILCSTLTSRSFWRTKFCAGQVGDYPPFTFEEISAKILDQHQARFGNIRLHIQSRVAIGSDGEALIHQAGGWKD